MSGGAMFPCLLNSNPYPYRNVLLLLMTSAEHGVVAPLPATTTTENSRNRNRTPLQSSDSSRLSVLLFHSPATTYYMVESNRRLLDVEEEERGTTYLAPPPRNPQLMPATTTTPGTTGNSHNLPPPAAAAPAPATVRSMSLPDTESTENEVHPPPTYRRQQSADPPARHIREDHGDEPSSFYCTSDGALQTAQKLPAVAKAEIIMDEASTQFKRLEQQLVNLDESEPESMDSVGDAWQRRQRSNPHGTNTTVVAQPIEVASLAQIHTSRDPIPHSTRQPQPAPITREISQSRLLPVGEEFASSFRIQPLPHENTTTLVDNTSLRLAEASVLSHDNWSSFDEFRSQVAQADAVYPPPPTPSNDLMIQRHQSVASSVNKVETNTSSLAPPAHIRHSSLNSTHTTNTSATVTASNRTAPPPNSRSILSTPMINTMVAAPTTLPTPPLPSTSPASSPDERLQRMKRNRKRVSAVAAVGAAAVGLTLGPVGAVAAAAGGYAVTRAVGKQRERRYRQSHQHNNDEHPPTEHQEHPRHSQDHSSDEDEGVAAHGGTRPNNFLSRLRFRHERMDEFSRETQDDTPGTHSQEQEDERHTRTRVPPAEAFQDIQFRSCREPVWERDV